MQMRDKRDERLQIVSSHTVERFFPKTTWWKHNNIMKHKWERMKKLISDPIVSLILHSKTLKKWRKEKCIFIVPDKTRERRRRWNSTEMGDGMVRREDSRVKWMTNYSISVIKCLVEVHLVNCDLQLDPSSQSLIQSPLLSLFLLPLLADESNYGN